MDEESDPWILLRCDDTFLHCHGVVSWHEYLDAHIESRIPIEEFSRFGFIEPLVSAHEFIHAMDNYIQALGHIKPTVMVVRIGN